MHEEKPVAAYTLSLVGLAFQVIAGVFFAYAISYWQPEGFGGYGMMGPWMMFAGPWAFGFISFPFYIVIAAIELSLGLLGILWMNNTDLSKVRTGSVLVLVASVIAFPTMFGFMIGSLLMLVGSILGLTWQPRLIQAGGA